MCLALSLLAFSASSDLSASGHCHHRSSDTVTAAQANYQNETGFTPIANVPISFPTKNFKDNFDVHSNRSILKYKFLGCIPLTLSWY